ncbi:MAG: universal stress protein [Proteobacteria bacterium]|nr:universal stress protein [Pseudomonadota bacterium]
MRILLALDDSAQAMDAAVRLASERGAGLTALFVLDTGWSVYIGSDFLLGSHARGDFLEYTRDDEYSQEHKALAEIKKRAQVAGVACEVKTVASRHIADEIIKEAAQGYDLLVMAAPFRRGLEVMRDAPSAILKAAPCDVLFVRGGE